VFRKRPEGCHFFTNHKKQILLDSSPKNLLPLISPYPFTRKSLMVQPKNTLSKGKVSFWQKSAADLFSELSSSQDGLTTKQCEVSYGIYGANTLEVSDKKNALISFFRRFQNPLVLLLLISCVLVALIGEIQNALLISIIILSSTLTDFIQEQKATSIAELLKKRVKMKAWVFRDHKKQEIMTEQLVPGDLIELSAGDLVPADGYLLNAKDFFVDQSSITGESFPVQKEPSNNLQEEKTSTEVLHVVLMGSSVISGWARALVCKTGPQTLLSSLTKTLNTDRLPTPFLQSMNEFGMFLIKLTFILILSIIAINLYLSRPWVDTFLFAVALGIGMTPEFLPMIISVSLAHGGNRLAKKDIITKRLSSIYALGRMDVLCTDKTGTLTEAHIRLNQATNSDGSQSDQVFFLGYLNSHFESCLKSPMDMAILEHKTSDVGLWTKIDEIPFNSAHRRASVLLDNEKERLLILKGPLEDVLRVCPYVHDEKTNTTQKLDEETRNKIISAFLSLSEDGLRTLGVGFKYVPRSQTQISANDEEKLIFAGLLSFSDNPRQDARGAIQLLSKDGIQLKVITGDNEHVTRHLCRELNVPVQGLLLGHEIESLTDQQLKILVEKTTLFCRVTPDQKGRIIRLLKDNGHVVGFLGDGINDVSALQTADVGISVKNAVDIAKEAAHFILLKRSLSVLHQGVLEGRRTFSNILKYIMMGTSSNLGNMISMVGAFIFLPFLPMLPVQILLNNLLYDLSEIAIPFDHVDGEQLLSPSKWDISFIRHFMLVLGPLSSFFDFCLFYILLVFLKADASLFQTSWFLGSLATQILVIFLIRTKGNPFKSRPHPYLVFSSLGALAAGICLPWSSLSSLFGLKALPLPFLTVVLTLTGLYLFFAELLKRDFYRRIESHKRKFL